MLPERRPTNQVSDKWRLAVISNEHRGASVPKPRSLHSAFSRPYPAYTEILRKSYQKSHLSVQNSSFLLGRWSSQLATGAFTVTRRRAADPQSFNSRAAVHPSRPRCETTRFLPTTVSPFLRQLHLSQLVKIMMVYQASLSARR